MNHRPATDNAQRWEWPRRAAGFVLMASATATNVVAIAAMVLFPNYGLTLLLVIVPLVFAHGVALSGTGALSPPPRNVAWLNYERQNLLYFLVTSSVAALANGILILLAELSQAGSTPLMEMMVPSLYMMASVHCSRYFRRNSTVRAANQEGKAWVRM